MITKTLRDYAHSRCRGSYQMSLLHGAAWSGADLRGAAQTYGGSYARSRGSLLARLGPAWDASLTLPSGERRLTVDVDGTTYDWYTGVEWDAITHPAWIAGAHRVVPLPAAQTPGWALRGVRLIDPQGMQLGLSYELRQPWRPTRTYWEHGQTAGEILLARQRKVDTRGARGWRRRVMPAYLLAQRERRERLLRRADRLARLVLQIAPLLLVWRADARAAGHCDPGISSWCIDRCMGDSATAVEVARLHPPQWRRIIAHAFLRARGVA